MTGKIFVYSTLTADNLYGPYKPGGADLPIREGMVLIKGGANVAGPSKHLVTPLGVVTEITHEQLALLRADVTFLAHERNGFITVSENKTDADHVAADMEGRDESAPMTPEDVAPEDVDRVATAEVVTETLAPAPAVPAPAPARRR
jgi:hypothetical protein